MTERGWGWSPTDIRRIQLVEWIASNDRESSIVPVAFYDTLPEDENTRDTAHGDLKALEADGLISLVASVGASGHAHPPPGGRA